MDGSRQLLPSVATDVRYESEIEAGTNTIFYPFGYYLLTEEKYRDGCNQKIRYHGVEYFQPSITEYLDKQEIPWMGINLEVEDVMKDPNIEENPVYVEAYLVYTSHRTNPTGRGKVGWTVGGKVSNAFQDNIQGYLKSGYTFDDENYKIPYRLWASLDYDLRKDLKFVLFQQPLEIMILIRLAFTQSLLDWEASHLISIFLNEQET